MTKPNEQLIEKTPHCQHGRTHFAYCADCHVLQLQKTLEQFKAELQTVIDYNADTIIERDRLSAQLSAKDKVLGWYENGLYDWNPAKQILAQYEVKT